LPAANEQMPVSGNYTVVLAEAAGQDRFRRHSSGYDEVFSAAVSKLVARWSASSYSGRPTGVLLSAFPGPADACKCCLEERAIPRWLHSWRCSRFFRQPVFTSSA
jgi:hypothetical protein